MKKTIRIPAELRRDAGIAEVKEDGTIRLSISSDEPYLRYDWYADEEYYEQLDHSPQGVDMGRIKTGTALLFNHDRDMQLGTINSPSLENGRCYVMAKMSDASDVAGYIQRVREGILKDTSIGYNLTDDGTCIGVKDGIPIYQFKFAINEASLVTIPADTSVGVGRQRSTKDAKGEEIRMREISVEVTNPIDGAKKKTNNETTRQNLMATETTPPATEAPKINVEAEREDAAQKAIEAYHKKCDDIRSWIASLDNPEWREAATEFAKAFYKPSDKRTFGEFKAEVITQFKGVTAVVETAEINMSKKEMRRFSVVELIRQAWSGKLDGFYKEKSDNVATITKRPAEGVYIPDDISNRSLQEIHGLGTRQMSNIGHQIGQQQRALTVGSFAAGGALVGTELLAGSLIELLLNKVAFLNGFVYLGGLVGNVSIPKVTGGQTSYWLPEGASVTSSNMTFSQLGLVPHRLIASTAYDKQLIAQASLSVEALVRDTIARIMAVEKNRAMINGSGSSGEPLGLLNITGVQSNTTTVNVPTWAQIVNFWTKLATANADMLGPISWLMAPAASGNLQSLPKIGTTFPIFIQENGMVNGYPVNTTNNVPSGLGILGVGSEFIVADWAGIDIVVNPYSLDLSSQIRTTVMMYTDNGMRHEVAFVVSSQSMAAA